MAANRAPRLRPEPLEDRLTPATFVVDHLDDNHVDGQLNLRDAVELANADDTPDVIAFAPNLRGGTALLTQFDVGRSPGQLGPTALFVISPIIIRGTGERIARDATGPA